MFFRIPQLPDGVTSYLDTLFDYLVTGASLLANYTPLSYMLILVGVIISVDVALYVYKFVMWILRKIPMLSIE